MAEESGKKNNPNSINTFDGSLNTDVKDYHLPKNSWTHARNAITEFETSNLGNEPSNKHCITIAKPFVEDAEFDIEYNIIGWIYLYDDVFAIFSTNNIGSEIGIFRDSACQYTKIVNETNIVFVCDQLDPQGECVGRGHYEVGPTCLNFNTNNLITGEARQNFDCTWSIYWSDKHRNPDRTMNVTNPPWKGTYSIDGNGCQVFTPSQPLDIDCDKIKLNRLTNIPCIKVSKGASGGSVLNGSYYATTRYTVNGQPVTDFLGLSNIVSLFDHDNSAGALNVDISGLDDSYSEYELVVISIVNQQTVARRVGLYGTNQEHISLDIIANDLPIIPLEFIPVRNPLMDSSDSITTFGDTLLRIAPKSKFDFNYQPLANLIVSRWTITEYPADYYRNGGTNISYERDENMCFFIEWEYDDIDRSSSFVISGRAPLATEQNVVVGIYNPTYKFENITVANTTSTAVIATDDGGYQIAEGQMGYHETDERYPIDKPERWGPLCGKKIRLHKFPQVSQNPYTQLYSDIAISPIQGPVIRVLGVKFYNINAPVDNAGKYIKGIKGYRILRGSREGNKTIIGKGLVNNMFGYTQDGAQFAYPNFPYNDLEDDPFISTTATTTTILGVVQNLIPNKGLTDKNNVPNEYPAVKMNMMTFHGPNTNFRRPFLGGQELKLDGVMYGSVDLKHNEPDKHPKHKLLTNKALFIAALGGMAIGVEKIIGKTIKSVISSNLSGSSGLSISIPGAAALAFSVALQLVSRRLDDDINDLYNNYGTIVEAQQGNVAPLESGDRLLQALSNVVSGLTGGTNTYGTEGGIGRTLGLFFRQDGGIPLFANYWGQGVDEILELIYNLSQYQQYALQQTSHCFYNEYQVDNYQPRRYLLENASYLGQGIQEFSGLKINNLYRARTVALKTAVNIPDPYAAGIRDTSKQTLYTIGGGIHSDITKVSTRQASSYYAALKIRLRNQYGQVGNVKQIPIGCVTEVIIDLDVPQNNVYISPVLHGGDVYITRYTEKNTMFFFYEWLYDQPDGFEYDYFLRRMLPYPAYWMNSRKYDKGDITRGGGTTSVLGGVVGGLANSVNSKTVTSGASSYGFNPSLNTLNTVPNLMSTNPWLPTQFSPLDRAANDTFVQNPAIKNSMFVVKEGYFYLFNSGIRDFYVESEVNVGYRDWDDPIQRRHYDEKTFTDIKRMFDPNPDVIRADNYYKYDYSLSVSKSFVNMATWATVQPSYYDPEVAETCYVYHRKRVINSLPQQSEQIRDSWRIFLANNYRDFKNNVTTVKSIGLTGAIVFFDSASPLQIQGIETLTLDSGTKITIGDGTLLQSAFQNITNADKVYQYGSCKDLRSIINTPDGLLWMSPDQGKIFTASGGLMDIAMKDMNWWFYKYMPYKILEDFPNYTNFGNPVAGVGCQAVYDNENQIVYFSKKDYTLRRDVIYLETMVFDPVAQNFKLYMFGQFVGITNVANSDYFKSVSWTISYDLKEKKWLSHHDWHPDLVMPSKNTFHTIKKGGIWTHNVLCNSYCKYYGIDYPFEVEYMANTGPQVNVLRSIEYYMEVFKYAPNCYDRYLYLTENFDEAVVWNNEQCSGLLKLNLESFEDPFANVQFPKYNLSTVDALYSKVENKYRIDQFADLTDDRGMFNNARRMLWITPDNGYAKDLNNVNLNYQKLPTEQKPFRGYQVSVFLRRKVCGDRKFILLFSVDKNLESKR